MILWRPIRFPVPIIGYDDCIPEVDEFDLSLK